jgi:hypothetical protein
MQSWVSDWPIIGIPMPPGSHCHQHHSLQPTWTFWYSIPNLPLKHFRLRFSSALSQSQIPRELVPQQDIAELTGDAENKLNLMSQAKTAWPLYTNKSWRHFPAIFTKASSFPRANEYLTLISPSWSHGQYILHRPDPRVPHLPWDIL